MGQSIEFRRLPQVVPLDIIQLMNHPKVRAQMPLTKDNFDEDDCRKFIENKENLWRDYGFGPWAFYINNQFAGWGGVQPEAGEADLAMVLHPNFWGYGKQLLGHILRKAFGEIARESVVIFFPPTRTKVRSLYRIGFKKEKEVELYGERFILYRLNAADAEQALSI